MDFPGATQTPLKKILTSEDLWDFSVILSKVGEWDREAFCPSTRRLFALLCPVGSKGELVNHRAGEGACQVWSLSRQLRSPLLAS